MWASCTFAYLNRNARERSAFKLISGPCRYEWGALADIRGSPVDRLRNAPLFEPFRHIRLPVRVGSSGASITGRTMGIPV